MAKRQAPESVALVARGDQPLIGVITRQGDHDVVRYFARDEDVDAQATAAGIQKALSLAGAWSDLDWEEMEAALDRIRHESTPTPPIEL